MFKTVDIPGGTADLYPSLKVVPPGKRRPAELVGTLIGRKRDQVVTASRLFVDGLLAIDQSDAKDESGEPLFDGGDVEISEKELGLLLRFNDTLAFALLHSWTIAEPLPRTEAEFLDIPGDVYDALRQRAAEVMAGSVKEEEADGFTPDSAGDLSSPTGA